MLHCIESCGSTTWDYPHFIRCIIDVGKVSVAYSLAFEFITQSAGYSSWIPISRSIFILLLLACYCLLLLETDNMGQRHQLFVIVIIAGRPRPLAALHNQFLWGPGAVARCLRLLQVFQAPENRIPIQQELLAARSRPEALWNQELTYDYRGSDCANITAPFPFIFTATTLGGSFDPIHGRHDRVHPLQFNTPFDGGDNNDGITIIDVTEQAHPRYCFVLLEGRNCNKPLSASGYLKTLPGDQQRIQRIA